MFNIRLKNDKEEEALEEICTLLGIVAFAIFFKHKHDPKAIGNLSH